MKASIKLFILFAGIGFIIACGQSSKMSQEEKEKWMQQGKEAVDKAATRVKDSLIQAMQAGGPLNAINVCKHIMESENAYGGEYEIRRTALKFRNPLNKPKLREKQVLEMMRDAHGRKQEIGPVLDAHDDGALYYYHPIMVQPLCLNCHGTPGKEITEEVFNEIKRKYPKDKAMGFAEGDFRGMWSVQLKAKI